MADRVVITTEDLEQAVRLNAHLESVGFATELATSLDEVRAAVRAREPDCLIVTGGLHEPTGARVVAVARDRALSTLGLAEVAATVRRLIERRRLQQRTGIIGESPAIQELLVKIEQMAPVTSTVLVEGESGTGKELVARAIHDLSPRRGKPFIAVN